MIEKTILDYLSSVLKVPCGMELPENMPASYIVLERTGSSTINRISTAILAVQSYGLSLYEAALLNEQVKIAMLSAVELNSVAAVHLNSDYNFTDTISKRYRYQAVFDITYYES